MSHHANITAPKSESIISNPFSDRAAISSRCSSSQTLSSTYDSEKSIMTVRRRSVSISKFTIPFEHVDSLDLHRSKQPKLPKLSRAIRSLAKRILPKSAKPPARVYYRKARSDIDQSVLGEDAEQIRAEVDTLVRNFSLRVGLEVQVTEGYEERRAAIDAEAAEERRRREHRKLVRFTRC